MGRNHIHQNVYFDVFLSRIYVLSSFSFYLRGKRKKKKVPKNKKEKHATKKQPQCPNGHKTKLILQALACTLMLTIAAKLHVRD